MPFIYLFKSTLSFSKKNSQNKCREQSHYVYTIHTESKKYFEKYWEIKSSNQTSCKALMTYAESFN